MRIAKVREEGVPGRPSPKWSSSLEGLVPFFRNNMQLFEKKEIENRYCVIDGSNLCHILWGVSQTSRLLFDEPAYAKIVRDFFESLFMANVKPIVLFEPPIICSGPVDERSLSRLNCWLADSQPPTQSMQCRHVFGEIIAELGIPKALNRGYEIELARALDAILISANNSYFFCDIPGFIHAFFIENALKSLAQGPKVLKFPVFSKRRFLDALSINGELRNPLIFEQLVFLLQFDGNACMDGFTHSCSSLYQQALKLNPAPFKWTCERILLYLEFLARRTPREAACTILGFVHVKDRDFVREFLFTPGMLELPSQITESGISESAARVVDEAAPSCTTEFEEKASGAPKREFTVKEGTPDSEECYLAGRRERMVARIVSDTKLLKSYACLDGVMLAVRVDSVEKILLGEYDLHEEAEVFKDLMKPYRGEFFDTDSMSPEETDSSVGASSRISPTFRAEPLPDWFIELVNDECFSGHRCSKFLHLITVLCSGFCLQTFFKQDLSEISTSVCTARLRQVTYGIVFRGKLPEQRFNDLHIKELIYIGGYPHELRLQPLRKISNDEGEIIQLPSLAEIGQLDREYRRKMFSIALLGSSDWSERNNLKDLDCEFPLMLLRFWARSPGLTGIDVICLLLSIIYVEQKYRIMSGVFPWPVKTLKQGIDSRPRCCRFPILHAFGQLQSILEDACDLHAVLGSPHGRRVEKIRYCLSEHWFHHWKDHLLDMPTDSDRLTYVTKLFDEANWSKFAELFGLLFVESESGYRSEVMPHHLDAVTGKKLRIADYCIPVSPEVADRAAKSGVPLDGEDERLRHEP